MTYSIEETSNAVNQILGHTAAIATLNAINNAARDRDARINIALAKVEEVRRVEERVFMSAVMDLMRQYNSGDFHDDDDDDMDDDE